MVYGSEISSSRGTFAIGQNGLLRIPSFSSSKDKESCDPLALELDPDSADSLKSSSLEELEEPYTIVMSCRCYI